MELKKTERLAQHVIHIAHALIQQVDTDGVIKTFSMENPVVPDMPSTYHLLDFLNGVDNYLFSPAIHAMLQWMIDPDHFSVDSPFTLDALAQLRKDDEELEKLIQHKIFENTLPDGGFSAYVGYLRGGDYFSTLWCVKILIHYDKAKYASQIEKAISYLLSNKETAISDFKKNRPSHLGFLGFILLKYNPEKYSQEIEAIFSIIEASFLPPEEAVETYMQADIYFVLEDLLEYYKWSKKEGVFKLVENYLVELLELENDNEGLPKSLELAQEKYPETLFFQTLARLCVVGAEVCKRNDIRNVASLIHKLVFDEYRVARYEAIKNHRQLKAFLERYGKIHENFEHYNSQLEKAWKDTPFDSTIFIMMPFEDTSEYRLLTNEIKRICKEHGYKAIRVDDDDRHFHERLWDNVEINMLSAKYAIAIYINDQYIDRLSDKKLVFSNPNVALEFGWFKSRGQDILILKDKKSIIPSDLQGFIWGAFDIKNPELTVEAPLLKWLSKLDSKKPNKSLKNDAASGES